LLQRSPLNDPSRSHSSIYTYTSVIGSPLSDAFVDNKTTTRQAYSKDNKMPDSDQHTHYSATAAETKALVMTHEQESQRTRLQSTINQLALGSEARTKAEREMSDLNVKINGQFGNFVAGLKSGTGTSSVQARFDTQAPFSTASGTETTPAVSSDHRPDAATSFASEPIHPTSRSIMKQDSDTAQKPSTPGTSQRDTTSSRQDATKSVSFRAGTPSGATAISDRIVAPGPPPKMSEEEADKGHKEWVERLKNRPIRKR
jgi:hypothetical protein